MKLIQWINMLVAGTDGSPSTMRVGVLMVLGAVLFNWVYITVHTGVAQPLDWEQVATILGALGFKAVQRQFEGKATDTTSALPVKPAS